MIIKIIMEGSAAGDLRHCSKITAILSSLILVKIKADVKHQNILRIFHARNKFW